MTDKQRKTKSNIKRKKNKKGIILISIIIISSFFLVYQFIRISQILNGELYIYEETRGVRLISDSKEDVTVQWFCRNEFEQEFKYNLNPDEMAWTELTPNMTKNEETYIYKAKLRNLEPDTEYFYKINDRDVMSFKTIPENITDLKILLLGDSQIKEEDVMYKEYRELAMSSLNDNDDIDFDIVIHLGDIVQFGDEQARYNFFFEDYEPIGSRVITFFTEGNHDHTDPDEMYLNIAIDKQYTWETNLLSLYSLNSIHKEDQQEIFDSMRANNSIWKIAFSHKPIFDTSNERDDKNLDWNEHFSNKSVDLSFFGHTHVYERAYYDNYSHITLPPYSAFPRAEEDIEIEDYHNVIVQEFGLNGFGLLKLNETHYDFKCYSNEFELKDSLIVEK